MEPALAVEKNRIEKRKIPSYHREKDTGYRTKFGAASRFFRKISTFAKIIFPVFLAFSIILYVFRFRNTPKCLYFGQFLPVF